MKKIRKISLVKTKISKVTHLQMGFIKAGDAAGQAANAYKNSQDFKTMCEEDTCPTHTHSRTTQNGNGINKG